MEIITCILFVGMSYFIGQLHKTLIEIRDEIKKQNDGN